MNKNEHENKQENKTRRLVAITGGTGFIGRKLVSRLLEQGYSVRILTRNAENKSQFPDCVQIFEADLVDPEASLDEFLDGVEVLYHCSGELKDIDQMAKVHIEATKRLVEAAKGRIRHWVQLSSVGVYGKVKEEVVDENCPTDPSGIYEKTKFESDNIVSDPILANDFSVCLLRPANVFGIGMSGKALGKMISAFRSGYFFFIGKSGALVNFIHVDNVIEALLLCGNPSNPPTGVFNLSDDRSMEDFSAIILKELDKKAPRFRLPESFVRIISVLLGIFPGFPLTSGRIDTLVSKVRYSNARLVNELGYSHKKTLEEGLHEYLAREMCDKSKTPKLQKKNHQDLEYNSATSNQTVISPQMLWVFFFCFTTFASIIFQELLLPLIPDLHAGNGLLFRDASYHNNWTKALVERIQTGGWSEWTLRPHSNATGLNASLLAVLYLFFGPDPTLLIPIHSALHATAGVLIFSIGRLLWPGTTGEYGGLIASILFVLFPSSINWYSQPLKDGYVIAGVLLILFLWLKMICGRVGRRNIISFALGNLVGSFLVFSVKPYILPIVMVIMFVAYLTGLIFRGIQVQINKKSLLLIFSIIVAVSFIINVKGWQNNDPVEEQYIAQSKELAKHKNLKVKNWSWEKTSWAPSIIDRYARKLATLRIGLTTAPDSYNAYSTMDKGRMPADLIELVMYIPRGLQIALWAPFPNTWFRDFSLSHAVGWFEIIIWYLLMPGILLTLYYKRSPGVVLALIFSLGFLTIYGYVTANVGTLHRLRYPYLFVLILIGTLGWVQFFINVKLKKKVHQKKDRIDNLKPQLFSQSNITPNPMDITRTGIVNAGILVSFITVISYLLLFFRDMMMAHQFGLGSELDGFYLAMVIPMFFVNAVSVPFGAMVIPIYQEIKMRRGKMEAQLVLSSFSFLIIISLFILCLILLLLGPWILSVVGWGFGAEQLTYSIDLMPFGIFLLFFSGSMILCNSVLNAHHRFVIPSLAQIVVPIATIICLFFLSNVWGITSVAFGMCIGQVLNLFVVLHFVKQEKILILPGWKAIKRAWHAGFPLFSALVISALFMSGVAIVDNAMASTLGKGSVGAYGLGSKVVLFVTGAIGASIVTVMLPHFSSFFASDQIKKGWTELKFYLFLGTMISIPLGLGLFIFIDDLIQIVFVGGELDTQAADIVAKVAAFGIIQLPFFTCYMLLIKFMNASKKTNIIIIVSFVGFLLKVILNMFLMKIVGVSGLALATSLSMFITGLVLLLFLYPKGYINLTSITQILLFWLLYLSAVVCILYNSNIGLVVCGLPFLILAFSVYGLMLNSHPQKKQYVKL